MSLNLPYQIRILNPYANVDSFYGTYPDIASALAATTGIRAKGLTVGIIVSGSVVEYWFRDGIADSDLVIKFSGGVVELKYTNGQTAYDWQNQIWYYENGDTLLDVKNGFVYKDPYSNTTRLNIGDLNTSLYNTDANLALQLTTGSIQSLGHDPFITNTYDLGTSSLRWRTLYAANLDVTTGLTLPSFTQGSVLFAGSGGLISQNNSQYFVDNTNFRVGFGTNSSLAAKVTIQGKSLTGSDNESAFVVKQTTNTSTFFESVVFDTTYMGGLGGSLFVVKKNGTSVFNINASNAVTTVSDIQQVGNNNFIQAGLVGGLRLSAGVFLLNIGTFVIDGSPKQSLFYSIPGNTGYYGGHVFTNTHASASDNQTMAVMGTFTAASGAVMHRTLNIQTAINQTGGGTGITRSVYINPTLTNAADFRALEISRGKVMFNGTGVHSFIVLHRLTTTERNALTNLLDGSVIYNTTTAKFQGYAAGAWVDFH